MDFGCAVFCDRQIAVRLDGEIIYQIIVFLQQSGCDTSLSPKKIRTEIAPGVWSKVNKHGEERFVIKKKSSGRFKDFKTTDEAVEAVEAVEDDGDASSGDGNASGGEAIFDNPIADEGA